MIYTCTLNPAIDLFIETEHLKKEVVNRTNDYDIQPNGKGVNVSFILKMLAVANKAIRIGGGFTNDYIESALNEKGIETQFIKSAGITRINVFTRVVDRDEEYKLVNKGPHVDSKQIDALLNLIGCLKRDDMLVVSGSFADGIPESIIIDIAKLSNQIGFKLVIDTSYQAVMETLQYQPFLLKPNDEELMQWFNVIGPLSDTQLIQYAQKLVEQGAQNVLLSLGAKGAAFINREQVLKGNAAVGKVVNTACSGDTMLGTFLAGMVQAKPLAENLKYSIAAASSTAFSAGLTDFTDVATLQEQIKVTEITLEDQ